MTLPRWLGAERPSASPCPCCGISRSASFAERTLLGVSAVVRGSLETARDAGLPGVLQTMDARAKVIAAFALILGVALSHSLMGMAAVALLAVGLARLSRLAVGGFLRRAWLVVPLFTGAFALPALLNAVTPGPELLSLAATPAWLQARGWPATLAVTTTGVHTALQLVLRVGASLSVVTLLTRTTPPGEVLKALRSLGVPRAFVLVATMTERYILTLVKTIEEMHLALLSRRIRPLAGEASRAFVTSRMGVVLTKANRTAEEVHLAMIARGFRGEVRTLEEPRLRARDVALGLGALGFAALVALASRAGLP